MIAFWTMAYKRGWATLEQLKQAVVKKLITAADYKQITGEDYAPAQGGTT